MKTALFRSIAMAIAFASIPAAAALPNLLQNPGFESGTLAWRPGGGSGQSIDTDVHSGAKSLKLTSGTVLTGLYQDVPVTAGKVYSISAWIKQNLTQEDAGAATFILYQYFDTPTWGSSSNILHQQYLEYVREAGPYHLSGAHTLAPDGAKLLRINLYISVAQGITVIGHFDDVSVVEGDYMTNKVNQFTNPGFENGTTGTMAHADVPGTSFSSSTEFPRSGARSLKITGNGNWSGVEQRFPVLPGEGYGVKGYCAIRTPSGGTASGASAYLLFRFRDASGVKVGAWYDFGTPVTTPTYGLMAADMRFAPTGATHFAVELWINQTSNNGFFDDIQVFRFVKNPNPPGITLRPVYAAATNGVEQIGIFDALGRKLVPKTGASFSRNGVYFTLLSEKEAKKSISVGGETR